MRIKEQTYDGVTLRYAAITLGKVKAWRETKIDTQKEIVVNALNAARAEGEPEWDDKRLEDTFDPALLTIVANDILKYSGIPLMFPPQTAEATPAKNETGEVQAAIGSTSTTSGAA